MRIGLALLFGCEQDQDVADGDRRKLSTEGNKAVGWGYWRRDDAAGIVYNIAERLADVNTFKKYDGGRPEALRGSDDGFVGVPDALQAQRRRGDFRLAFQHVEMAEQVCDAASDHEQVVGMDAPGTAGFGVKKGTGWPQITGAPKASAAARPRGSAASKPTREGMAKRTPALWRSR